jgi:hypothetical protein
MLQFITLTIEQENQASTRCAGIIVWGNEQRWNVQTRYVGSLAKTLSVDPSLAYTYTEFTFVDVYSICTNEGPA